MREEGQGSENVRKRFAVRHVKWPGPGTPPRRIDSEEGTGRFRRFVPGRSSVSFYSSTFVGDELIQRWLAAACFQIASVKAACINDVIEVLREIQYVHWC